MAGDLLEGISDQDMKRFACCYLTCDRNGINWEKALELFGGDVKLASFKTVTNKATAKALVKINGGGGDGATSPKKKAAGGGKRKKAADEDGEDAAPKKKRGGGKKKSATPPPEEDDDAEDTVKGEEDGDGEMA